MDRTHDEEQLAISECQLLSEAFLPCGSVLLLAVKVQGADFPIGHHVTVLLDTRASIDLVYWFTVKWNFCERD